MAEAKREASLRKSLFRWEKDGPGVGSGVSFLDGPARPATIYCIIAIRRSPNYPQGQPASRFQSGEAKAARLAADGTSVIKGPGPHRRAVGG